LKEEGSAANKPFPEEEHFAEYSELYGED